MIRCLSEYNQKKNSGFVLIEALTVLFIFVLITTAFYSEISVGTRHIANAKNRLGALSLANEKMEIARNISYDDLGTDNGAVSGVLREDEEIYKSTKLFYVHTLVEYVQDSLDGNFPSDVAWNDYKKVTIEVSWDSLNGSTDRVVLVSRFVPTGLEVADPNAGILMINVFSDQPGGTGIAGANVHIVNTETGLDTNVTTGSDGSYMLTGDKVNNSIQKYQIYLTKSDYESVQTYDPYPISTFYPVDVHASVVLGSLNVINIVQNKLADLMVESVDYLDEGIGDVDFTLIGGRKMGTDTNIPPNDIFNFDFDGSTNSEGEKEFNNISPGIYNLVPEINTSQYELISVKSDYSFQLFSDNPLTIKIKLADKTRTGMMVKVVKSGISPAEPIANASVTITKGAFTDNLTTDEEGVIYFPKDSNPLEEGVYDVQVVHSDYEDNNFQVTVNQNELNVQTADMIPVS